MAKKRDPKSLRNQRTFTVYLPDQLVDDLKIRAAIDGKYISEYVREIIEFFFKKH
jgi:plasmid stability protein